MAKMKVGDVIKQKRIVYTDKTGREVVDTILVASAKCPKWYLKILQDTGIKIRQE